MNTVEVVLTPRLLPLYEIKGKIVVVIDILRATSSICIAFANGAERIIPVSTPEESKSFGPLGFLCAAERNGSVVEGFDIGNSPQSYTAQVVKGRSIALTTTNGTHAIELSKSAHRVVIGSFLNLTFLCNWLKKQNKDVVLHCAGWKDKFNLEDTLFAGAICTQLQHTFSLACDSAIAATDLFCQAESNLVQYIQKSSHAHRFQDLGIEKDIEICMQTDTLSLIPVLEGEFLIKMLFD